LARNTCTLMAADQAPLELPLPAPVNFFADLARKLRDDPASLAEDTLRSFRLTHACLCARDAADRQEVVTIPAW